MINKGDFNPRLRPRIKRIGNLVDVYLLYFPDNALSRTAGIPEGAEVKVKTEPVGNNLANRTLTVTYQDKDYNVLLADLQRDLSTT